MANRKPLPETVVVTMDALERWRCLLDTLYHIERHGTGGGEAFSEISRSDIKYALAEIDAARASRRPRKRKE
jgi:hypothetical protein